MDREEFIMQLQGEIRERFLALTEDEQDLIRQNKGTPYAMVLRKVLGNDLLSGMRVANPRNLVTPRRGLAAR
jgi:hypothetical protein